MRIILALLAYSISTAALAGAAQAQVSANMNSASVDAFGRWRTSSGYTLFDSKQTHQQETVYWTQSTNGAGSAVTFDSNFSSNTLTAGTTSGAWASWQTRTYWPYSPGKSNLVFMTGNFMGGAADVVKRIGQFDDLNGFFVQLSGTTLSAVVRSSTSGAAVNTDYPRTGWDDPLDGTGVSGYNIDLTKSQIWIIDYEWLGVGRIRFGVWADQKPVYFKYISNTNLRTGVYMKTPNLPLRYEVRNQAVVGAASPMSAICSQVSSEGGIGNYVQGAARTAIAGIALTAGQTLPLIAIRVKSSFARGVNIRPVGLDVGSTTSANGYVGLHYNAQVSGGTWVSVTNSAVEYNNTCTAITITNTACVTVANDLTLSGARSSGFLKIDPFLWGNFDYDQVVPDVWVLSIANIAGNNTYVGTLQWEETR